MRRIYFISGCLLLAALWLGPLPQLASRAFFAHMALHMGVVAVAAPLLALGLAGGRFDPVPRMPALFAAIPASLLEFVVVWAWHAPQLHHTARRGAAGLIAEQGMFFAAGLLVWLSAFGGAVSGSAPRRASGVVALLLTSMHMTLLGALLALAPRSVYPHAGGAFGLDALEDQHLGGVIMLVIGGVSYLLGGLGLMVGLLRGRALETGCRP